MSEQTIILHKANGNKQPPFDTLAYVKILENGGIPPDQAECFAEAQTMVAYSLESRAATKADLEVLRVTLQAFILKVNYDTKLELQEDINGKYNELKGDNKSLKAELKEEISSVRTELKEEISSVCTELKEEINSSVGALRKEMYQLISECKNYMTTVTIGCTGLLLAAIALLR